MILLFKTPETHLSKVDFPTPDFPKTVVILPSSISKLKLENIKDLVCGMEMKVRNHYGSNIFPIISCLYILSTYLVRLTR